MIAMNCAQVDFNFRVAAFTIERLTLPKPMKTDILIYSEYR
jgi:hypothetical protein